MREQSNCDAARHSLNSSSDGSCEDNHPSRSVALCAVWGAVNQGAPIGPPETKPASHPFIGRALKARSIPFYPLNPDFSAIMAVQ